MSKEKISIPEIIDLMVKDKNITKKTADEFVRILISTIEDALLSGDSVKVKGLGTFKPQWNEARRSVDVNTGNEIIIPGFYRVVFAPENDLRELINEPFAHLETVLIADEDDDTATSKQVSEEVSTAEKSDVNLSFLSTQAAEIKEILSDINAISERNNKQKTEKKQELQEEDIADLRAENSELIAENEDFYDEEEDWEEDDEEDAVEKINSTEESITILKPETDLDYKKREEEEPLEENDFDIVRDVSVLYSQAVEMDDEPVADTEISQSEAEIGEEPILIRKEVEEEEEEKEIEITHTETETETEFEENLREERKELMEGPEILSVHENADDESVNAAEETLFAETPAEKDAEASIEEDTEVINLDEDVEEITEEPTGFNEVGMSHSEQPEEVKETAFVEEDFYLEEDRKKKNILGILVLVGSLVIIGLGAFFLSPYLTRSAKEKKNQERLEYIADSLENLKRVQYIKDSVLPKLKNDSSRASSLPSQPIDSVIEKNMDNNITPAETPKEATVQNPVVANGKNIYTSSRTYREVLATEKMVIGSQLTKFARQYYGHPNFWVYIYEANRDKINDPNNVPTGIDIKIPKLDSRLVDPKNKESMNYALKLQAEYLK